MSSMIEDTPVAVAAGVLRQRWWKLCLQRKCTVGKSKVAPQAEQRVALKVVGLVEIEDRVSSLFVVSVR
jgi:hypothetical protein